eukprot:225898-Chlamydomonas_euryale.AAC.1
MPPWPGSQGQAAVVHVAGAGGRAAWTPPAREHRGGGGAADWPVGMGRVQHARRVDARVAEAEQGCAVVWGYNRCFPRVLPQIFPQVFSPASPQRAPPEYPSRVYPRFPQSSTQVFHQGPPQG